MGYQYKFDISGVEYGMSDVKAVKLESPLFDVVSVGNTCSAELDITFWPISDVPKMARIVPYVEQDSEWVQLGEFFADTRTMEGDALHIVAYDSMMKAEVVWEPDQGLEFPLAMPAAVSAIAETLGVEVDSRTALNDAYTVDYPTNDYTMREVLGFIGGAHAGNWIFTREGKLLLVPLFSSMPEETYRLIDEKGDALLFGGERIRI